MRQDKLLEVCEASRILSLDTNSLLLRDLRDTRRYVALYRPSWTKFEDCFDCRFLAARTLRLTLISSILLWDLCSLSRDILVCRPLQRARTFVDDNGNLLFRASWENLPWILRRIDSGAPDDKILRARILLVSIVLLKSCGKIID